MKLKEEKNNFKQLIVVGFIIALVFFCLGFGSSYLFSKKDASTVKCKEESIVFTSDKIQLESKNKSFEIGENIYKIKYVEEEGLGVLYLNEKKVATIYGYVNLETTFVDNYLFVEWPGAQGGPFAYGYFDENGTYYDISENNPLIYKVSYGYDGVIYGYIDDDAKETEYFGTKKVELILNGNKVTVKDIK